LSFLFFKQGTKIQGTCFGNLFVKFEKYLIEDGCYFINKPRISNNTSPFSIVKHPYKITLGFETSISECNKFSGPRYGFEFSTFEDIFSDEAFLKKPCG